MVFYNNAYGGKAGYDNFAEGGKAPSESAATGINQVNDWGTVQAQDIHRLRTGATSSNSVVAYGMDGEATAIDFGGDDVAKVGKKGELNGGLPRGCFADSSYDVASSGGQSDSDAGKAAGGLKAEKADLAYDDPSTYGLVGHIGGAKDNYEKVADQQRALSAGGGSLGDGGMKAAQAGLPNVTLVEYAKQDRKGLYAGSSSEDV